MEPEGNQSKAARTGRFLGVVLIILGIMMLLARLASFAVGPLAARSVDRAIRHDVDRVTREVSRAREVAREAADEVGRIDVEPPVVRVAPVAPVPPVPPTLPFHPTPRLWWHMPGRRALTAFLLLIVAYLVLRRRGNRAPVAVPANTPETDRPPAV
jgi:hypothetical protein